MSEQIYDLINVLRNDVTPYCNSFLFGESDPFQLEKLNTDQFPRIEIAPFGSEEIGFNEYNNIDEEVAIIMSYYYKRSSETISENDTINLVNSVTYLKNIVRGLNRKNPEPCKGFDYVQPSIVTIIEYEFLKKISSVILEFRVLINTNIDDR